MIRSLARAASVALAVLVGTAGVVGAGRAPARADDPCLFGVAAGGATAACVDIELLQIGWKWSTTMAFEWSEESAGSPAAAVEAIGAGLAAIGAAGVDPGAPQWGEAVLAPLTSAAGQAAPVAPKLLAVTIDRDCPALASALTGAGVELAAGLALLVEAGGPGKRDPQVAGSHRAAALQRFVALREAFTRAATAARGCAGD